MLSLHWWMNIGLSRFFERECARVWTHSQINPVNPGDPSIYKSSRAFYCCSFLSTWGRCTAALFVWNGALDTFGAQRQSSDGVNPKDLCQRIGGACADAWLLRWQILFFDWLSRLAWWDVSCTRNILIPIEWRSDYELFLSCVDADTNPSIWRDCMQPKPEDLIRAFEVQIARQEGFKSAGVISFFIHSSLLDFGWLEHWVWWQTSS